MNPMNPMNRLPRIAVSLVALAALGIADHVWAANAKPFSAELTAVVLGTDREAGLFAVEGRATLLGRVTGNVRHENRGPRELGIFHLENGNGDRLSFSYEIATNTGLGSYEVEDGSGRFADATGGGAVMIHDPLPDGSYPITLEGTVSF